VVGHSLCVNGLQGWGDTSLCHRGQLEPPGLPKLSFHCLSPAAGQLALALLYLLSKTGLSCRDRSDVCYVVKIAHARSQEGSSWWQLRVDWGEEGV
jgi:hypothetical protein